MSRLSQGQLVLIFFLVNGPYFILRFVCLINFCWILDTFCLFFWHSFLFVFPQYLLFLQVSFVFFLWSLTVYLHWKVWHWKATEILYVYGHTHFYIIGLIDRVGGVQGRTPEVSIYRFFTRWVFKKGCSPGCQCSKLVFQIP